MRRCLAAFLTALLVISVAAFADQQTAEKPKVKQIKDRVEVVLHPGAAKNKAVAVVLATNVNLVRSLSLPLKFVAGPDSVWVDSVSFVDTRTANFGIKNYKFYPKRSAVMILTMSLYKDKKYNDLQPGTGEVARIYLSAKGKFPTDSLRVGPVTLPPDNKLMFVTDALAAVEPLFDFRLKEEKPQPPPPKKEK